MNDEVKNLESMMYQSKIEKLLIWNLKTIRNSVHMISLNIVETYIPIILIALSLILTKQFPEIKYINHTVIVTIILFFVTNSKITNDGDYSILEHTMSKSISYLIFLLSMSITYTKVERRVGLDEFFDSASSIINDINISVWKVIALTFFTPIIIHILDKFIRYTVNKIYDNIGKSNIINESIQEVGYYSPLIQNIQGHKSDTVLDTNISEINKYHGIKSNNIPAKKQKSNLKRNTTNVFHPITFLKKIINSKDNRNTDKDNYENIFSDEIIKQNSK